MGTLKPQRNGPFNSNAVIGHQINLSWV